MVMMRSSLLQRYQKSLFNITRQHFSTKNSQDKRKICQCHSQTILALYFEMVSAYNTLLYSCHGLLCYIAVFNLKFTALQLLLQQSPYTKTVKISEYCCLSNSLSKLWMKTCTIIISSAASRALLSRCWKAEALFKRQMTLTLMFTPFL